MARKAKQGAGSGAGPGPGPWDGLNTLAEQAGAAMARFAAPAAESFSRLQGLLMAQAGKGRVDVDDLVRAWQQELGRMGPLAGLGDSVGQGLGGVESLPPLGFAREQMKRAQDFAQAQLDYQQGLAAYTALVAQAQQRAFPLFQTLMEARARKKAPIDSAREVFDLWIEAAEAAWQEVASTGEFSQVYAGLVNAQSRLQIGLQMQVEPLLKMYGVASRRDLDDATRRVHDLELELRELKAAATARRESPAPQARKPAAKRR